MKKVSKLLALFLAVIVMMSSFGIMTSAISSSSSKEEILTYYEKCLRKVSAKEDIIKAECTEERSSSADLSKLTEADKKETMALYDNLNYEEETKGDWYFHGDACADYYDYVYDMSEFFSHFTVRENRPYILLFFKSATYKVASNGEATVKFVISDNVETYTYTAKIDKNGYIQSYTCKYVGVYTRESARGKEFKVTETDIYTCEFVYKTVDVESISLSTEKVRISPDGETTVTPVIKPSNATYKGVYAKSADEDIATCYVDDDGKVRIQAVSEGETTISVYTYDGDFVAELEVKVAGGSFFDMIIEFFRSVFEFLFGFLFA